jgi:hypothetical protein
MRYTIIICIQLGVIDEKAYYPFFVRNKYNYYSLKFQDKIIVTLYIIS